SFNRVETSVMDAPKALPADTVMDLSLSLQNLSSYPVRWAEGGREVKLEYRIFRGDKLVLKGQAVDAFPDEGLAPGEKQIWRVHVQAPSDPGEYRLRYQFLVEGLFSGRSGNFCELEVY
ncbi:hypothetical protein RZS08_43090, partial [Arthrospira platensis SPKY1]|nr:hypothetical protein [Arthrospira platensis SPKY1]